MIVPKPLKYNDTIGIAAPSASFYIDPLNKGIAVLKEMGFRVEVPDAIFEKKRYLAGNDKQRAQVFEDLLIRDDIQAIICARGGFGSIRMLPFIETSLANITPKKIIGFSDITPILNYFALRYNWVTFHGPVVTMLADADQLTIESLYMSLTESLPKQMPHSRNIKILSQGNYQQEVVGRIWGGNLATLCHTIGTPFFIDCQDGLLFLEDRGEVLYKIDRMMTQMRLAGCFKNVKGVLLGTFKDCGNINKIHDVILECFDYDIPVYANYQCGHNLPNYTFPIGCAARLSNGIVEILSE